MYRYWCLCWFRFCSGTATATAIATTVVLVYNTRLTGNLGVPFERLHELVRRTAGRVLLSDGGSALYGRRLTEPQCYDCIATLLEQPLARHTADERGRQAESRRGLHRVESRLKKDGGRLPPARGYIKRMHAEVTLEGRHKTK